MTTKSLLLFIVLTSCDRGPKRTSETEAAPKPVAVAPTTGNAPAPAPVANAAPAKTVGESCYSACLRNGPDDSPMTKADWPNKTPDERANDCSAACADEGMPVEQEQAP